MKRLILTLFVALTLCGTLVASPAFSTTIDFDALGASYTGSPGGSFSVGDVEFTGWSLVQDSTTPANYLALDFALGGAGTNMANITFANPVYLNSFDFSTCIGGVDLTLNPGGTTTNIMSPSAWTTQNYPAGTLVKDMAFSVPTGASPAAITIVSLDNLKYSAVPLPGALCFLASALLGITGLRKRYFS